MSGNCQNCLHWGPPTAKTGDPVQLVASYNFRLDHPPTISNRLKTGISICYTRAFGELAGRAGYVYRELVHLTALLDALSLSNIWISLSKASLSTMPTCRSAILPLRSINSVAGIELKPKRSPISEFPIT